MGRDRQEMKMKRTEFKLFSGKTIKKGVEVVELTLDNGLTVYLNEDHSVSEVFGAVGIKVGAKDDPSDATGMAHYQEHMLFKGTTHLGTTNWNQEKPYIESITEHFESLKNSNSPKEDEQIHKTINDISVKASEYEITNELNTVLRNIGAYNINAYTSYENTMYYNSFPANQIEKWLEIYSHRFSEPVFRSFQAEMGVVLEEKSISKDSFSSRISKEYNKRFFKVHPYGQASILGKTTHLQKPSLKRMYDFYKTYYVANNMVLSLSGKFDTEELIPLIKKTFGNLPSGEIPKPKKYIESNFKGREFGAVRLSPMRYAMIGFRIPHLNHPDEFVFDVLTGVLSNENETGLLDRLRIENKLLDAEISYYNYQDYGQATFYLTPKVLKQSLRTVEKILFEELEKLKTGAFPDWLVDAVKLEAYRSYIQDLEHVSTKGMLLAESYTDNRNAKDIETIPSRIMAVTKDDIVRVAKKYFGRNYLAFYSRIGFPGKKNKKNKSIKPIRSNSDSSSEFAERIKNIAAPELKPEFVDFQKDIQRSRINESKFYYTHNPINDIFELGIYYGVGTHKIKLLRYAAGLMNYAGCKEYKLEELNREFDKIGCTYSISAGSNYLTVYIGGIEQNFNKALQLVGKMFANPVLDDEHIDVLHEDLKIAKKVEGKRARDVFGALTSYVLRGDESPFIDRFSYKEIKRKTAEDFIAVFSEALNYDTEFYYVGEKSHDEVKEIIAKNFKTKENQIPTTSPERHNYKKYNKNTVFFTNFRKTNQSQIQFYIDLKPKNLEELPLVEAFNNYMAGDLTGVILEELREKRSLVYSADAHIHVPFRKDENMMLIGELETSGEKTIEAVKTFLELLNNMPKKPEKLKTIKSYLLNSAVTSKVHFRDLAETIDYWERKGYKEDPYKFYIPRYETLTFEEVYRFYEDNIKGKPYAISVLGSKKHINPKHLRQFGELKKVKSRTLYRIKKKREKS